MKWTGKNPNFVVKWSCEAQTYFVYYKATLFAKKYRRRDVETYLN